MGDKDPLITPFQLVVSAIAQKQANQNYYVKGLFIFFFFVVVVCFFFVLFLFCFVFVFVFHLSIVLIKRKRYGVGIVSLQVYRPLWG